MFTLCRAAHSGTARHVTSRYMWMLHRLGCSMLFDAARPKNSIGKLSVPSEETATLYSVVQKTADRVAPTPAPANGVPTKGERVAYIFRHKYGLTWAAAAGNNFTFTSILYFATRYLPFFLISSTEKNTGIPWRGLKYNKNQQSDRQTKENPGIS